MRELMHQRAEFLYRGGFDAVKAHDAVFVLRVNAVEKQHVKMNVQVQCRAEALNQGDSPGMGSTLVEPGLLDQVGGHRAIDDLQHFAHHGGLLGKQKTQFVGETQHPLPDGLFRQHFINQQGGGLRHSPSTATRAEPPPFATESNQAFMLAIFAAHPQESVIKPTAFEELVELLLNEGRQRLSLSFELGTKRGVMGFDELIEQRFFWSVALVGARRSRRGHPGQWHDAIP